MPIDSEYTSSIPKVGILWSIMGREWEKDREPEYSSCDEWLKTLSEVQKLIELLDCVTVKGHDDVTYGEALKALLQECWDMGEAHGYRES